MAKSTQNTNMQNLNQEQMVMMSNALQNAKDIICPCGGTIFLQGFKLKKLSRLLTGEESDRLLDIPTVYCKNCNKELDLEKLDNDAPPEKEVLTFDFKKK